MSRPEERGDGASGSGSPAGAARTGGAAGSAAGEAGAAGAPAGSGAAGAGTSGGSGSGARPSFRETFVAVGQQTLDKSRHDADPVVSVAVAVTVLMAAAALLYLWVPWLAVVALVCAIILLWGRWMLARQVTRDLAEMASARESHAATGRADYARFVRLRAEQMLRDNKALTRHGKALVTENLRWAEEAEEADGAGGEPGGDDAAAS